MNKFIRIAVDKLHYLKNLLYLKVKAVTPFLGSVFKGLGKVVNSLKPIPGSRVADPDPQGSAYF